MRVGRTTLILTVVAPGILVSVPFVISYELHPTETTSSLLPIFQRMIPLFAMLLVGWLIARVTDPCPHCGTHLKLRTSTVCATCEKFGGDFSGSAPIHYLNPALGWARALVAIIASVALWLILSDQGAERDQQHGYIILGVCVLLEIASLFANIEVQFFSDGILWTCGYGPWARSKWIPYRDVETVGEDDFIPTLRIRSRAGVEIVIDRRLTRVSGHLKDVAGVDRQPGTMIGERARLKAEIERRVKTAKT